MAKRLILAVAGSGKSTALVAGIVPGERTLLLTYTKSNVETLERSLERAGRPVTFYTYTGTRHWFFEPDVSQAYNEAAANLAWDRTLAFLRYSFEMPS